ncbi:hypothetical protein O1611_g7556 [Lasiodiplodia mahajangana]|uniref:Uncharacterized protein n=1 Tax=Lasiodiplodia mahajangana TaxID=1108764 RepID=A0ACC2JFF9_9PEZI|nr:hypothetical protein O1611_g7556 [Lasiodiplodia mahajangana]
MQTLDQSLNTISFELSVAPKNTACYLEEAPPTDPLHARARELLTENGILGQYETALELLADRFAPKAGAGKVVTSLLWPFNKKQTEEILDTIERLKSLLLIDFQIDHFKLSQAIKEETESIYSVNDIKSRQVEGTGMWFLESKEFYDWMKGVNNTLFCPGIPGAGKTILSSLVINHLQKTRDQLGAGVACLYCNHKEDKDRKVIDSVSSLLRQLVEESLRTLAVVQTLYKTHKEKKRNPP